MRGRPAPFNSYLVLAPVLVCAFLVFTGCTSPEQRRRDSMLYTELGLYPSVKASSPDTNKISLVTIAGANIPLSSTPILTQSHLKDAEVIDDPMGGYNLSLTFDDHGKLVLDSFTVSNRGRNIGVYVRYGIRKEKDVPLKVKWLAAPKLTRQIEGGIFIFTPDTTREELDTIVEGLRNAAADNEKPWVF